MSAPVAGMSSDDRPGALSRALCRQWLGLAMLSLVIAGVLAAFLVVGRAPGISDHLGDPLLFERCLVVHVDLALVVWFFAFFTSLFFLLPSRRPPGVWARASVKVSAVGVVLMVGAAGVTGAQPVLSNYLPAVDHPLFALGLGVFGLGVGLAVLDPRMLPGNEAEEGFFPLPGPARVALRAGGLVILLALATFGAAVLTTPPSLPPLGRWELIAWGGGHALQVASEAGMVAVWLVLLRLGLGRDPIPRSKVAVLCAVLVLPLFAAPLVALGGTTHARYRETFTDLMRWGIFPVVVLVLALCGGAIVRARADRPLRDPRVLAFLASAGLAVTGFVLGALIRGSNTMVPAHYHASIGAVTVAYMAITPLLLERLGMPLGEGKLSRALRWQPLLFGTGQLVFAIGFGLAGAGGMARKTYASAQHIRTAAESVGLGIMAIGGLVAIAGGVLFLWAVARAWLGSHAERRAPSAPVAITPGGVE